MRRDVFQAISDPQRREILGLLGRQRLTVNEIAGQFQISRPAISRHVKILTECGLVVTQQVGRQRYCAVRPEKLKAVADWIEPYRQLWEERLDRLDVLLKEMQAKKEE